jgi:hypothetical protein
VVVPVAKVFASLPWQDCISVAPTQVGDGWGWDAIHPAVGEEILQLSGLWWQQTIADGALAIMLVTIDANRMCATVPTDDPCLKTAASMLAAMLLFMPTHPNPAMGAVVASSGLNGDGIRDWSAPESDADNLGLAIGAVCSARLRPTGCPDGAVGKAVRLK